MTTLYEYDVLAAPQGDGLLALDHPVVRWVSEDGATYIEVTAHDDGIEVRCMGKGPSRRLDIAPVVSNVARIRTAIS